MGDRRRILPSPDTSRLRRWIFVLLLLAGAAFAGCSASEEDTVHGLDNEPRPIDAAEGAVCGMLVRDQPAPRAQVIHRDGTRLYLCGIGDLMVHLEAPSPHGAAVRIYLEAMEANEDPQDLQFGEHEWIRAEDAIFRVGDERPRMIMGRPVMIYRDRATAEKAIRHGPVEILDFDEFQAWWHRPAP